MRVFIHPLEVRRIDRFRPSHCPWPDCKAHHPRKRFRRVKKGFYWRQSGPRRKIPRYLCPSCERSFSLQSFSCTYYMKRPELLQPIAAQLMAGSAHRQIARNLGCAPSTVTRIAARLGRHALLFQAWALEQLQRIDETVVFDHFETFVFSQEDRLAIATPVGQKSWFSYGIDPASHRRVGKRSARKRALVRPLPEAKPRSIVESTKRVWRLMLRLSGGSATVVSDDAPAYTQAMRELSGAGSIGRRIYANPHRGPGSDPAVARERDLQMFPVDLLHKIWRHTQAHVSRETIAFARRSNALLERGFLFIVWRNFVKKVSERRSDPVTPAMRVGLLQRQLTWREVLSQRLFPCRIRLPDGWETIYRRGWITPAVGRNLPHALAHAF
jgi:transposase-like protein